MSSSSQNYRKFSAARRTYIRQYPWVTLRRFRLVIPESAFIYFYLYTIFDQRHVGIIDNVEYGVHDRCVDRLVPRHKHHEQTVVSVSSERHRQSGVYEIADVAKRRQWDSNPRQLDRHSHALTTELLVHT